MSVAKNSSFPTRRLVAQVLVTSSLLGSQAARAQTKRIETVDGSIEVPDAPKRIVALDAGIAGSLLALGAPVIAADTRFPDERLIRRTGFPPLWSRQAVAQKTLALPPKADGLDLDAIKAAAPDLIFAGGRNAGGQASKAERQALAAIAPTFVFPDALLDWRSELELIAKIIGRDEAVSGLLAALEARSAEVAGKIALPAGPFSLLQANSEGLQEDPYAITSDSALGRSLRPLGFELTDAAAKVVGISPDQDGRISVPLASVPDVFATPNLLVVSAGTISLGQLCCNPPYRQLQAVDTRQRWELDEAALRPDYLSALRMLDMIESSFPKKT